MNMWLTSAAEQSALISVCVKCARFCPEGINWALPPWAEPDESLMTTILISLLSCSRLEVYNTGVHKQLEATLRYFGKLRLLSAFWFGIQSFALVWTVCCGFREPDSGSFQDPRSSPQISPLVTSFLQRVCFWFWFQIWSWTWIYNDVETRSL